jgi:type IV fimbrial biogenesis protein FimT
LVELLVAMAILAFLLAIAIPAFGKWTQNMQIRNVAESIQNGLQQARAEALRRNTTVRFQLTTSTDNTCALSTGQANWVINLGTDTTNPPFGACGKALMPLGDSVWNTADSPYMVQTFNASGSPNVTVASNGAAASLLIVFGALGQVVSPTSSTQWDVSNSTGTCSAAGGSMTCMRIMVSVAGQIRMCNPNLTAGTPQGC